jgi:hypothetical protein
VSFSADIMVSPYMSDSAVSRVRRLAHGHHEGGERGSQENPSVGSGERASAASCRQSDPAGDRAEDRCGKGDGQSEAPRLDAQEAGTDEKEHECCQTDAAEILVPQVSEPPNAMWSASKRNTEPPPRNDNTAVSTASDVSG